MLEFLSEPCSGEIAFEMNGVRRVVSARDVFYSIKWHSDPFAMKCARDAYSATLEVRDALAVEEQESYESVCARLRRSEAALAEERAKLSEERAQLAALDPTGSIAAEIEHADTKFRGQVNTDEAWSLILGEEVGEVCRAILQVRVSREMGATNGEAACLASMDREVAQVAATAIRWLRARAALAATAPEGGEGP